VGAVLLHFSVGLSELHSTKTTTAHKETPTLTQKAKEIDSETKTESKAQTDGESEC